MSYIRHVSLWRSADESSHRDRTLDAEGRRLLASSARVRSARLREYGGHYSRWPRYLAMAAGSFFAPFSALSRLGNGFNQRCIRQTSAISSGHPKSFHPFLLLLFIFATTLSSAGRGSLPTFPHRSGEGSIAPLRTLQVPRSTCTCIHAGLS